jgi:hypothetical protein
LITARWRSLMGAESKDIRKRYFTGHFKIGAGPQIPQGK